MVPAIRLMCVILQLNWVYPRRLKGLRKGMSSRAMDLVQAHILLRGCTGSEQMENENHGSTRKVRLKMAVKTVMCMYVVLAGRCERLV